MAYPPYPEPPEPFDPLNPGAAGRPRRPARQRPSRALIAAAVAAVLTGAWLIHDGSTTSHPPAPGASDAVSAGPAASSRPSGAPAVAPLPYSPPVRIRIPAIRVDAPLMRLGLDAERHLQVPPESDPNLAGWYADGAAPGAAGAAVIAGHVDTHQGKAVFYDLGAMHKGETIQVLRADGRTAVFTIYGINVYAKRYFPADKVYADPPGAEIRVITCGGAFVKGSGYYGNVVVYGRLTAVKPPPPRPPAPQPPAPQPGVPQPGGPQPGPQQPSGDQPGGGQPGGGQPGGDQPGSDQPGSGQPGDRLPPGDQPPGTPPPGQQPGGRQPGTAQPTGDQPGGDQPGGDQPVPQ